ncbi:MAG: GNAT family N-acetyltransferase [Methanomassiliicoccus sp.]|nr:GNAT family N-acetyltransferase [Methanomassiliicoccus sp.]
MRQKVMIGAISRTMTRKDLPQVLAISRENMSAIIFSSWGVEYRDEDLLHILLEPSALNEVLELDGRIVAYFSVDERNGNLFINSIQVQKACQGCGLGKKMMAYIEEQARQRESPAIELLVQYTNRSAMEFYRRMGYRLISRQGNNYLMRRTLDPGKGPRFVGLSFREETLE